MGKADPSLVKASLVEAKTRAESLVPEMKNLYNQTTVISQGYMEQIGAIMSNYRLEKKKERLAKNKQLEPFKKIADETLVKLFTMKEAMPDKIIDAFEARIQQLQDEYELVNTLGDNDSRENRRARMKLMGELQKISNQTVELRTTTMAISDRISNNLLNTDVIQADIIPDAQKILDFKNLNESDVRVNYGKDGIIFTIGDKEYTMQQLNEAFPAIDKDVDTGFLAMTTATGKQAKFDATGDNAAMNYNLDQQRGYFLSKIKTNQDFQQYLRRLEGTDVAAFQDALLEDISIPTAILNTMFIDHEDKRLEIGQALQSLDINGDGVITESDGAGLSGVDMETFNFNMDLMIDIITNPSNEIFDLELSKGLLADYYVGGVRNIGGQDIKVMGIDEQVYYKNYYNEREKYEAVKNRNNYNTNRSDKIMINNQHRLKKDVDAVIESVIAGNAVSDWRSFTWTPGNDGMYTGPDGKKYTPYEMLVSPYFGVGNRIREKYSDQFTQEIEDFESKRTVPKGYHKNSVLTYSNGDTEYIDVALMDYSLETAVDKLNDHFKNTQTGLGNVVIQAVNGKFGIMHKDGNKVIWQYLFAKDKDGVLSMIDFFNSEEFVNALK